MSINQFRSTEVYGNFINVDSTDGTIKADANFQRNLTIQNNLILGNETINTNTNIATDTGGTINFTLNKVVYNLTSTVLSYLVNITSDVQTQINNASSKLLSLTNI